MTSSSDIVAEARELQKAGKIDEALTRFDDALAVNPRDRDALFRKASCLRAKKRDYDAAIELYDEALDVDPHYEWSWFQRGLCYEKKRLYKQALPDLDSAIEIREDFPQAWRARVRVLHSLKKYKQGVECAEHFDTDEADSITYTALAACFVETGDGEHALPLLEKRLAGSVDEWVASLKIRALIILDRIDEAQSYYDENKDLCGGDPDFDRCKGRLEKARSK